MRLPNLGISTPHALGGEEFLFFCEASGLYLTRRHKKLHKRVTSLYLQLSGALPYQCTLCTASSLHFTRFTSNQRWLSTKRNSFQLDAISFSISPTKALDKFISWAHQQQGLEYLIQKHVKISAIYAPVWSFDMNIRFIDRNTGMCAPKPKPLDVYSEDTVFLPGWSVYSGYSYRRSLIDPVHRQTLLYMGDHTTPFDSSTMLKSIPFEESSKTMEIYPDPWNATKGAAIRVMESTFDSMASRGTRAETEVLKSRRVYMPTYVVEYKVLGLAFEAFLSGCDPYSSVSGVSHVTISNPFLSPSSKQASDFFQKTFSSDLLRRIIDNTRLEGLATIGFTFINYFLKTTVKLMARFHIIGIVGSAGFITFRKLIKPWMDSKTATAEWERQRLHEAQMHKHGEKVYTSHFTDDGSASRYFHQNRSRILNHLRGQTEEDTENLYGKWWEYVKRQAQQQQQQQQARRTSSGAERKEQDKRQREHQRRQETHDEVEDSTDPYKILGIQRSATMSEISQAFRREMLKNHPDTKPNASEKERMAMTERSKIITDAYRKLKNKI